MENKGELSKVASKERLVPNELMAAAVCVTLLIVVSAYFDAPLDRPINSEGIPTDNIKAPWIFLGIQQLLKYFDPFWAGIVFPAAMVTTFALAPYVPERSGVLAKVLCFSLLGVYIALVIWGFLV